MDSSMRFQSIFNKNSVSCSGICFFNLFLIVQRDRVYCIWVLHMTLYTISQIVPILNIGTLYCSSEKESILSSLTHQN